MEQKIFTADSIWHGGHFLLAMEIGERSDERLFAALQAAWNHPSIDGCYGQWRKEPHEQQKIQPTIQHFQTARNHYFGVATLPNNSKVACGTFRVREDISQIDWLGVYIPMGALSTVYDVAAYPSTSDEEELMDHHRRWIKPLEVWFYDIAAHIFESVDYKLGLIGPEVSGYTYASWIAAKGVPERRGIGYLVNEDGKLVYYPSNIT